MAMNYLSYVNGRIVSDKEAKISPLDSAYIYGEGLFETLIAHKGHVLFIDRHLKRLFRGARFLGFKVPWQARQIEGWINQLLDKNRLSDAFVRLNLSRRETVIGTRKRIPGDFQWVIWTRPLDPFPERSYQRGIRLIIVRTVLNDPYPLSTIKGTNFLSKILARREIGIRKADEGILLNSFGRLTECAGSNLFLVQKGKLLTAPLSEGLLPGVTRSILIELAQNTGIPVEQRALTRRDLSRAEEVFITSTLKGVLPVRRIERMKKKVSGPVTSRLSAAYQELVRCCSEESSGS